LSASFSVSVTSSVFIVVQSFQAMGGVRRNGLLTASHPYLTFSR